LKIDIFENGITAWKESILVLEKILNGEVDFSNYRRFIINLQSGLELLFKKMLFDKNEFMIFSFDKFQDKVLKEYKNSTKEGKSIFEYVASKNKQLPHTVNFKESYQRLVYLYNMDCFNEEIIANLLKLENLRNNLVHFEVDIDEEVVSSLAKLLLDCDEIFQENIDEYGWGNNYILENTRCMINKKDLNINKLISENVINQQILNEFKNEAGSFVEIDINDYELIAEIIQHQSSNIKLSKDELIRRIEMLVRHGYIEENYYNFSYGNDDMDSITVIEITDKFKSC